MLAKVGKVTILWAKMEGILDAMVLSIFHQGGGDSLEATAPRASLDRKLQFLRTAHSSLPVLASVRPAADDLIDRIHAAKQRRHDIIHGFADAISEEGLAIRVIKKDGRKPRGFSFDSQTVTPDDLDDLFRTTGELFNFADQHFHAVLATIYGEGEQDEGGSLAD